MGKTKYTLVVEISGGSQKIVSEQELLVCRPINRGKSVAAATENKVGGYFGVGQTSSRTEFCIESNTFSPGQSIPIIVNADNSKCNNSIKKFKFKIWREITYVVDGQKVKTGEYLKPIFIPGCKAKEQLRHEHNVPLPMVDSDGKTLIPGTCYQDNLKVSYALRCFVKHSSIMEMGQGHCVSFPLHIIHKPDDNLTEEPFDKNYRVNAKTAEFDDQRDLGDCTFNINKDVWKKPEDPCNLTYPV